MPQNLYGFVTIPFGKHRGKRLKDVSTNYLEWMVETITLTEPLKTAVQKELWRRGEVSTERHHNR
jgi:hypothetical protein